MRQLPAGDLTCCDLGPPGHSPHRPPPASAGSPVPGRRPHQRSPRQSAMRNRAPSTPSPAPFRLRRKGPVLRNPRRAAPIRLIRPRPGQIQLPVHQGSPLRRDIGGEHADLAVLCAARELSENKLRAVALDSPARTRCSPMSFLPTAPWVSQVGAWQGFLAGKRGATGARQHYLSRYAPGRPPADGTRCLRQRRRSRAAPRLRFPTRSCPRSPRLDHQAQPNSEDLNGREIAGLANRRSSAMSSAASRTRRLLGLTVGRGEEDTSAGLRARCPRRLPAGRRP